jgi:two-component system, LuxR family, response regulator FixJ
VATHPSTPCFSDEDTRLPDSQQRSEPHRVYVVDDDSMVRRALFFALRAGGFQPRTFASGSDFLEEADSLEPGCVLLDLRMPGVDGFDVLKSLGERVKRLPVVIITAHGEVSSAVAAMKSGATDFLEKPFADNALIEVLRLVFDKLPEAAEAERERSEALDRLSRLTPREREVFDALITGLSNKLIAHRLRISARTVEVHRANLMSRLEATSLAEAVRLAALAGVPLRGPEITEQDADLE